MSKATKTASKLSGGAEGSLADSGTITDDPLASSAAAAAAVAPDTKEKKGRSKGDCLYYRVKCKDNGVGMPHDKVG